VETPCYFGILQLVRSLGFKILEIPLDPAFGLTSFRFEEAVKKAGSSLKALVTVSNFSNPLGSLVPDEAKREIVSIAARNDVVIIEDDIYGELYFEGKRPLPYKTFDKSDTVITCGSYSKTICPAFRVGYACNKKYAAEIAFHKSALSSGVSAFAEESIAAFLDGEGYEKHLRSLRSTYKTLVAQYSAQILSSFPSGTKISQPKGGFVLWVQLPKEIDSRNVQRKALEQNISIAPGPIFSASNKDYVNFMRMNCAIPWSPHSVKAISKLAKIL
jgi:DNA-binding transcriptional MocR family regulator